MSFKSILMTICFVSIAMSLNAAVPNVINNQGRLTNSAGEPVADGAYLVRFIIYDAPSTGTELWNSGYQTVNTYDGLFSYQLGSIVALTDGIFSDTNRYLGITIGTNPEIIPRTRFITTSYAFKAQIADIALDANSLGGSQPSYFLDWNNLTNVPVDIADGDNVDTDWNNLTNVPVDIADGDDVDTDWNNLTNVPVGFADGIDDGGTSYTAGSGLQLSGSAFSILNGGVTSAHLGSGSVGTDEIAADAVGASEIASGAVGVSEIATNGVGLAEIAANAVGTSEVVDNSLTANDLATNSVAAAEIATGAVGTTEVADNSLTANDLAANSVGASEIATNAVGSAEIVDGSVTASDLATNSVSNIKITANAVTSGKIAAGAVGTTQVLDNSLTATDLAANSVGASEIATNAVGTDEIANSAVGSPEIAANSITVFDIALGGVASGEILNNSILDVDILDEPGVSQGIKATTTMIGGGVMLDIITTTIEIPASGYIFLIGKCYVLHSGATGNNIAYIQIDETEGGGLESPGYMTVGDDNYPSTASFRFPTTVTRMYFKTAGTYTFRIEGDRYSGNQLFSTTAVYQPVLTAIYFPTSYGTVSTISDDPNGDPDAEAVSITDEDGNTQQAYKIDLRNLELRAQEAEIRALEAKDALEDAQNENR